MPQSPTLTLGMFSLTLFLSATLLFLVQPMVGKMLLPLLGGTPAVWNTCMVFFQATLLLGYLYTHVTTRLGIRRQIVLHAGLLLVPLLVLPMAVQARWLHQGEGNPLAQVLLVLLMTVGLPFFVVSTSAPLLQRWFSLSGHPTADDPYFLYGASNLGSMAALLGYPTLVEPALRLAHQSQLWTVGYGLLVLCTLACAGLVWRASSAQQASAIPSPEAEEADTPRPRLTLWQCLRWIGLALVPSSLMLGATTHITTDIAAIPLLWVLPLALYLLSFILVFSRLPQWIHQGVVRVTPVALLVLVFMMTSQVTPPFWKTWMMIVLHLGVLFLVAMLCHGELAQSRPPATQLTAFYLWMSFGGVLGGLVNALAAPLLFKTVAEYPLGLVLACFCVPTQRRTTSTPMARALDLALPVALVLLTLSLTSESLTLRIQLDRLSPLFGLTAEEVKEFAKHWLRFDLDKFNIFLKYGIPVVCCYLFTPRILRFGLSVGALVFVSLVWGDLDRDVLYRERSFFGVLKVDRTTHYNRLLHGTTLHGVQEHGTLLRQEPLTYYHRTGPIGQVFDALDALQRGTHVAAIGLGTGTLACYGDPGRSIDFYEIDPAVYRIASNPRYFTYLQDGLTRGATLQVIFGDARLKLVEAPDKQYGLIIVDAFSSDAIPVHLITREALALYIAKLADGGIVALHISNRHLDLAPVLGNLARAAQLVGLMQQDRSDDTIGRLASQWVIIARQREDFGKLLQEQHRWKPLEGQADVGEWSDDFSNMLSVFQWNK